ncbi:MAG: YwaF family protein [Clostridia bacterium]|nr:YwaF family protein [Clostridia bacterium]
MFEPKHLIILAICAVYAACALILLAKKRPPLDMVTKILLAIGVISETIKICTYIVMNEEEYGGYLPKTDLPFHLCSIQLLFMVVLVLSKSERVKKALYSFMLPTCLIGGFAALMIPTSSSLSVPIITVQYFLFHTSIVVFAIYLYLTNEISLEFRDYISACLMLFAAFFVAVYLNGWINDYEHPINFMYVVAPPVEGLPYLNKDHGWLVYIVHYAALAYVCITLCFIRPVLRKIKSLFARKEKEPTPTK